MDDQRAQDRHAMAAHWLVGGGEMGKLIRSMDWSKTPLGPVESWPQSLRTTVSLGMLLRLCGHEVQVAHTGPTALQRAQEHRPAVILLDIGLPGMDGYRVAQHLRQQEGMGKVRLIATTGYGQDSDRQRSQEAGFDYHLVKPVDPAKLQDLLAELGKQL